MKIQLRIAIIAAIFFELPSDVLLGESTIDADGPDEVTPSLPYDSFADDAACRRRIHTQTLSRESPGRHVSAKLRESLPFP